MCVQVWKQLSTCMMIGIRSSTLNLMLRNCDLKGQRNVAVKVLHGVKLWCIQNGLTRIKIFQPIGQMPDI